MQFGALYEPLLRLSRKTVFLSSTASIWSQTGSGYYALANSLLNWAAEYHFSRGMDISSMRLGPFSGVGMAMDYADEMKAVGLKLMRPTQLLEMSMKCRTPNPCVVSMDAVRIEQIMSAKGKWNLFKNLTSGSTMHCNPVISDSRMDRLEVEGKIRTVILKEFENLIDSDGNVAFQSIDSITAVEFASSLSKLFGQKFPSTVIYDHPTLDALAIFIKQGGKIDASLQVGNELISHKSDNGKILIDLVSRLPRNHPDHDLVTRVACLRWDADLDPVRGEYPQLG